MTAREKLVKTAELDIGVGIGSKMHKHIVDVFNKIKPDGWAMTYTAPWCACAASAWAIETFGADKAKKFFPLSANCGTIIEKAKKMKIWKEQDSYKPAPGDWVLYDWDDNGVGDNHGSPDHVGVVQKVTKATIYVIEGNKGASSEVGVRKIPINGTYIRGFVVPNFRALETPKTPKKETAKEKAITQVAKEVIRGKWGNGDTRKRRLKAAGYDYDAVQKRVNELLKG